MKYLKKLLSLLLVAVMVAGMLPAYAAGSDAKFLKQLESAGLLDYLTVSDLNEQMTRLDVAKLLAGLADLKIEPYQKFPYSDCKDLTEQERQIIAAVTNAGLIKGYEDGSFHPEASITRAEVAAILYRYITGDYMDKQPSNYSDANFFKDFASGNWYAGYVNYCAYRGVFGLPAIPVPSGYTPSAEYFYPNDKLTFVDALIWAYNVKVPGSFWAPTVTAGNVTSTGKIKLTWNGGFNSWKYEVYRATSKNGTYKLIKTTSSTSFTNTSATAGKTYYYKVRAVDGSMKTEFSEVVSRTCDLAQPKVTITVNSKGNPKLTWDKIDGAVKYEVYRATGRDGTYKLIKTTTSTSFTNTSAAENTTYYYKVKAIAEKSAANSAYSEIVVHVGNLAKPKVTATNVASSGKIKLTWGEIENAEKYQVYRATSKSGTYKLMKTTTSTSYTNTSATTGKTYYYKVRAISGSVKSDYSAIVSRTCDLAQPKVTVKLSSSDNPRLTWDKVDGAVKYQVYRATSKDGTYKLIKTTTSTSFTNTSVTAGTTYYYKVKAIAEKSAANSAYSEIVIGTKPTAEDKQLLSDAKKAGLLEYCSYLDANAQLTRLDAVKLIMAAMDLPLLPASDLPFTDCDDLTEQEKSLLMTAVQAGIINGTSPETFAPHSLLTGYQAAAILLRMMGVPGDRFIGDAWMLETAICMNQCKEIFGAPDHRNNSEPILVKRMLTWMLNESTARGTNVWGKPWYFFRNDDGKIVSSIGGPYVSFCTNPVTEKEAAELLGYTGTDKITVEFWDNGVMTTIELDPTSNKRHEVGGQGTRLEFYKACGKYRIVMIETYLAKVAAVDKNENATLKVYCGGDENNGELRTVNVTNNGYKVGDFLLVNYNEANGRAYVTGTPTTLKGKQTVIWWNAEKHAIDGVDYLDNENYALDAAKFDKDNEYLWLLDQYNNVIGSVAIP